MANLEIRITKNFNGEKQYSVGQLMKTNQLVRDNKGKLVKVNGRAQYEEVEVFGAENYGKDGVAVFEYNQEGLEQARDALKELSKK